MSGHIQQAEGKKTSSWSGQCLPLQVALDEMVNQIVPDSANTQAFIDPLARQGGPLLDEMCKSDFVLGFRLWH